MKRQFVSHTSQEERPRLAMELVGGTWGSTRLMRTQKERKKLWVRAFIVVSKGRNEQDRVISRFRIG